MFKIVKKIMLIFSVVTLVVMSFGGITQSIVHAETSLINNKETLYTASNGETYRVKMTTDGKVYVNGELTLEIVPTIQTRSTIWIGDWMYNFTIRGTRRNPAYWETAMGFVLFQYGGIIMSIANFLPKDNDHYEGEYVTVTMHTHKSFRKFKVIIEYFKDANYTLYTGTYTSVVNLPEP